MSMNYREEKILSPLEVSADLFLMTGVNNYQKSSPINRCHPS